MRHTVTEHTLATGTKGLLIDVPGSEVVNILIRFNSGFQFSPKGKYELSHFVEHLIADGNKDYPTADAFKIEFAKNGAYRNAYTTSRVNGYVAECAAFELPRIMKLLTAYLAKPLFPESDFDNELNNVREEITRFTTEPLAVCSINLTAAQWPNEVERFQLRMDQLSSITIDDVRAFYQRTHTAENMRFYIAGDLAQTKDLILNELEVMAKDLPKGKRLAASSQNPVVLAEPIVEKRDIQSVYYDFNVVSDPLNESERRAARLARSLLFNGPGSRIYGPMRKHGLAYTIGGAINHDPNRSELEVWGFVTEKTIEPLFELVAGEVNRIKAGDCSGRELKANCDLIIGASTRSHQTSEDLLSWYAGNYDTWGTVHGIESEYAKLRKVTPEEVVDVMTRLTTARSAAASFVGKPSANKLGQYSAIMSKFWT